MMSQTIRTKGAELVVEEAGMDGPALVFLHYWGGSARTWDAVAARLPARRHRVLVNHRGWGASRAMDGRYDLEALADDVEAVVEDREIARYVLVGHSMGGKVAQVLAGRRTRGLAGLVLVAPAPPTPMEVPAEVRAGMLASYQSREGVLQALEVLAGPALGEAEREQVIADTLRGEAGAKRYWPEQGMLADVSAALNGAEVPVEVLVAGEDQVEREAVLRPVLSRFLPQARFTLVPNSGHLIPLEAPEAVASSCERMCGALR